MSHLDTIAGRLILVLLFLDGGCSLFRGLRPERLPDGKYRVTCNSPLANCLDSLVDVCRDGYEIVHAGEKRERKGPPPVVSEIVSSEAVVRCLSAESFLNWGPGAGSAPKPPVAPDAAAPASPPPAAAAPGCVPGLSQACVGPGGCPGGQVCAADGRAFGPCDCATRHDGGTPEAAP